MSLPTTLTLPTKIYYIFLNYSFSLTDQPPETLALCTDATETQYQIINGHRFITRHKPWGQVGGTAATVVKQAPLGINDLLPVYEMPCILIWNPKAPPKA